MVWVVLRKETLAVRIRAKAVIVVSSYGDMALLPALVARFTHLVERQRSEVFFEISAGDEDDVGALAVAPQAGQLVHGPSFGGPCNHVAVQLCNGTVGLLLVYPFGTVFLGNWTEAAL